MSKKKHAEFNVIAMTVDCEHRIMKMPKKKYSFDNGWRFLIVLVKRVENWNWENVKENQSTVLTIGVGFLSVGYDGEGLEDGQWKTG